MVSPHRSTAIGHGATFLMPNWLGIFLVVVTFFACAVKTTHAQRSLGIDISAWQSDISQTTWNNIHNVENRDFVYLRSSRGGTTGYYNQSDPNNNNGQNTLSQRYDDPYFAQNIKRATDAGLLAGSYHFSRPEILSNTGTDEADHFMEMAGAWMRPGYLMPVHDLESGDGVRSDNSMAQFALDFSDRMNEVMGIRPAIYVNGNYANYVIGGASSSLSNQVVDTYPTLWSARWQANADPQTDHPSTTLSWIYGPWDNAPHPTEPWSFWQYSATGRLNSFKNGNSDLDFNVAHGGMEFLKDNLVPALWTNNSDGEWTTLANWNSGVAPIAPVQGPGQVPRVGRRRMPTVRLPTEDDTVILDRTDASIDVTLSSGTHNIRKLIVRETLNITGGDLTVNYIPTAESTPFSAQFSAPVSLTGGSLSVHTLQVDVQQTFSLGGTLTLNTLQLMPHRSLPAKLAVIGDVNFNPLANAAAVIVAGAGTGRSGVVDLGGADREWQISDGTAAIDLEIEVPVTNGGIIKSGFGTLELSGANTYTGDTSVLAGVLSLDNPTFADAADIFIATDAVLDLNFSGSTDTVDSLFLDGISQSIGIWGSLGSGAEHTSSLLTGPGLLQVTTFEAPIPGDFNFDGQVNAADLAVWQADYGTNAESDGNGFLVWQRNSDSTSNLTSAATTIPEPSVIALVVAAVLCFTAAPAITRR